MENILVSIRVRPLNKQELAKGTPWKLTSNTITLNSGASTSSQTFSFDRVFGTDSKTADIYDALTKRIISSTVQGINGTIFAYGQTSSGKTYTMRGSPNEPGIIPLAIQDVFRNIRRFEEESNREFLLRVSYMEIYNEEIKDLLAPENSKLQVHESIERGIYVAGLLEEIVDGPEQVLQLMEVGEAHRHTGETNMNVHSSRSHTIFRMVIESRDRSEDDPSDRALPQKSDPVRVSHLNLVDLAGSERVNKTGAEGTRLKEGTHINKSLMTLGNVINKLSEGIEKQGGHVPYRDSKLTRILQPALGGNARTLIVCNVTPAWVHVDETRGTLQFASRANRVTNCAQVNEIMTEAALLKRQKKEIEELRRKLQESPSDHWEGEILNLRNELLKTELEKERMAMELLESQQKIENLSTMVINSAVDDRDFEKRNKKGNRRETWCARPLPEPAMEEVESKKSHQRDLLVPSFGDFSLPINNKRSFGLPPPFGTLMEEEDGLKIPLCKGTNFAFDESLEGGLSISADFSFPEPGVQSFVVERRRRSSMGWITGNEVEQQISDLQAQFDSLQCEHAIKMKEKDSEIDQLRRELAHASLLRNKSGGKKSDTKQRKSLENDKRGKSLDGWKESESVAAFKQLQIQVRNLEVEKLYMQRELDNVLDQAREQNNALKQELAEVCEELNKAKEESRDLNYQVDNYLKQVQELQQKVKRDDEQSYLQLVAAFNDLKLEVDSILLSPNVLQFFIQDSLQAIRSSVKASQECLAGTRYLSLLAAKAYCQEKTCVDRFTGTQILERSGIDDFFDVGTLSIVGEEEASRREIETIPGQNVEVTDEGEGTQIPKQQTAYSSGDCEIKRFDSFPPQVTPTLSDLEDHKMKKENISVHESIEALQNEFVIHGAEKPSLQMPIHDDGPMVSSVHVFEIESNASRTTPESEAKLQVKTDERSLAVKGLSLFGRKQEQAVDHKILSIERDCDASFSNLSAGYFQEDPFSEGYESAAGAEFGKPQLDLESSFRKKTPVVDEMHKILDKGVLEQQESRSRNQSLECCGSQLNLAVNESQSSSTREAYLKKKLKDVMAALHILEGERDSWANAVEEASQKLDKREEEVTRMMTKVLNARYLLGQSKDMHVPTSHEVSIHSSDSDDKLCLLEQEFDRIVENCKSLHEAANGLERKIESVTTENERLLQSEACLLVEAEKLKASLQLLEQNMSVVHFSSGEIEYSAKEGLMQGGAFSANVACDIKASNALLEEEYPNLKNAPLRSQSQYLSEREVLLQDEIKQLKKSLRMLKMKNLRLKHTLTTTHSKEVTLVEKESAFIDEANLLKMSSQAVVDGKSSQKIGVDEIQDGLKYRIAEPGAVLCELDPEQSSFGRVYGEDDEKFSRLLTEVDKLLQDKIELKDSLRSLQNDLKYTSNETERLLGREAALLEEVMNLKSHIQVLEEESQAVIRAQKQEHEVLFKRLSELQDEKDAFRGSFQENDGQLREFRAAASEALKELEIWQQRYHSESCQFRSEISALRKELLAVKTAPAGLVKERDSLHRDLEKLKVKAKDTEAKLKSSLQDKSKLETGKANMERELKQLRQSTFMQRDISRRDSVVDQRRQSVALGLNKTKNQLYSVENALQMKTEEVERLTYELLVVKESYSKVEFAMAEAESYSKEQMTEAEKQISALNDKINAASIKAETLKNDLTVAKEECRNKAFELISLRDEIQDLRIKLTTSENHIKAAEVSASELAREKDEIVQELIDAHINFQKEKADLTAQAQENREKCNALNFEIVPLAEELQKVKNLQEELMDTNRVLQDRLQHALEANSVLSLDRHKQVQLLEVDAGSYKDRCRQLEKEMELTIKREQDFRISGSSQVEKLRNELQLCKMKLSTADEMERSLLEENCCMLTSNMKLQVALDATKDRLEVFEGRLEESDWELTEFKSLLQKAGFMRGDAWNLVSLQQFEKHIKSQNDEAERLEVELASKKLEMIELEVEFENMRGQCEKFQEEIKYLQTKVMTPAEETEHKNRVLELAEQNRMLQSRLQKEEDKSKEFLDLLRAKELSLTTLQTTLEGLYAQNMRLEKKLAASKAELQSAQQLNKLVVRAGAVGKATTSIFKSGRQDKLQEQLTAQSASSLSSSSGLAQHCASPFNTTHLRETSVSSEQGSFIVRRIPLGENAAVTSAYNSEGKGARSILTSPKFPQSVRPSSRGLIGAESRQFRRNKENLGNL